MSSNDPAPEPDEDEDEAMALIVRAVEHGVTANSPGPVPPGETVVLAAGVSGRYACVVVVRRDPDAVEVLLKDAWFLGRDAEGRWVPWAASGTACHDWVLTRPEAGSEYPDWRGSELVLLGGQWAVKGGDWLTELTVMASRVVTTVAITYAGQQFRMTVPDNGFVTVPAMVGEVDDVARFCGYGEDGRLVAEVEYRPIDREDVRRRSGWLGLTDGG
jgi:hypothetical protein